MKIELGDQVKDKVTGFVGIVTATSRFLSGCDRVGVQAPAKKGEIKEVQWFDELQLKVLKKQVVTPVHPVNRVTGGPRSNPTRHSNPTR